MGHGGDPWGLFQPSAVCRTVSRVFTSLQDCLSRVSRVQLSLCSTLQEWGRGHEEEVQAAGFPTSDQAVHGWGFPPGALGSVASGCGAREGPCLRWFVWMAGGRQARAGWLLAV